MRAINALKVATVYEIDFSQADRERITNADIRSPQTTERSGEPETLIEKLIRVKGIDESNYYFTSGKLDDVRGVRVKINTYQDDDKMWDTIWKIIRNHESVNK